MLQDRTNSHHAQQPHSQQQHQQQDQQQALLSQSATPKIALKIHNPAYTKLLSTPSPPSLPSTDTVLNKINNSSEILSSSTNILDKSNNNKNCIIGDLEIDPGAHSGVSVVMMPSKINHTKNCYGSKEKWSVKASYGSRNTTNPIREIIETMNLAENPNKRVIPLSIGDPTIFGNLKPCKEIVDALNKAVSSGKYFGYQTASGMECARDAVANYHNKFTGNNVKRQDVILTSGCSHALDLSICVLADRGQNILIPTPGFPLYRTITSVYGINIKQYNLLPDDDWKVDLKHLESLIDKDTAAVIVNNPSNPCGSVFSREHLLDILEVAERYRKPVIADEIYDKFVFHAAYDLNTIDGVSERRILMKNERNKKQRLVTRHLRSKSATYKDPSISKCPNRRYRYNGDDGPEQNNDQELSSSSLSGCSVSTSSYFEPEKENNDILLDVNLDGVYKDDEGVSVEGNGQVKSQSSLANRSLLKSSTSCESLELSLGTSRPFIAMSSLTDTVPILTCGGISKTCLIPGLRLGWIVINDKQGAFESVRDGLGRLTQRLMGPSSSVQGALPDILQTVPESFYQSTMLFIHKNAIICYDRLVRVKGLHPHLPQGSMYLMVGFEAKNFPQINGDLDFTSKLMNEQSVLVLPGKCFDFPNYFRLCLTVPMSVLEEALGRIEEFCTKYYVSFACNKWST